MVHASESQLAHDWDEYITKWFVDDDLYPLEEPDRMERDE